jgi:hypothetical protein
VFVDLEQTMVDEVGMHHIVLIGMSPRISHLWQNRCHEQFHMGPLYWYLAYAFVGTNV